MKIMIVNGPSLNMLGIRNPDIYGKDTYLHLCRQIKLHAKKKGVKVKIFQSNHEGKIVDIIHSAYKKYDAIIINPAAYTHTSIAIADALEAVNLPAVEVHISDTDAREDFRKISYVRSHCLKTVKGKGFSGYLQAMDFLCSEQRYEDKN